MKHNHELVARLQLPEGRAARLRKGQIVIVSVSPKVKKVDTKMERQEKLIPYRIYFFPEESHKDYEFSSNREAIEFAKSLNREVEAWRLEKGLNDLVEVDMVYSS